VRAGRVLALLVATWPLLGGASLARAAGSHPIVFVPLDDRPVTLQLPQLLGEIAGRRVIAPPRALLGNYLRPGDPDAIVAWLGADAPANPAAFVLSTDMLAYGGLVASRVPGPSYADAFFRMRTIARLRARFPDAWIGAFGTVMRLAPTGVPAIGDAAHYFAAYPTWKYIQKYAKLHDPLAPSEEALAQRLREQIGAPALDAYLRTRGRDYAVDRLLIADAAGGTVNRVVLGQDDAGPVGLHVPEVNALANAIAQTAPQRASIEPGADELGMVLVAHALAREAAWTPRVAVRFSTPEGASYQDPLEFTPIGTTIERIVALCGAVRDETNPQIVLYVRVPGTSAAEDDALVASMRADLDARRSVALVDLSFEKSYADQGAFAQRLLRDGIAARLDAYAAWNTDANSTGTALAEAVAAGAGRRMGTYSALAHETFTFMRFADDVDFHVDVRPELNRWLDGQGVTDHTYLLTAIAEQTAARNRALLWNDAAATLQRLYPALHIAAMQITLPWNRTFETEIDVRLAPNL
jgi:hypothetical protein